MWVSFAEDPIKIKVGKGSISNKTQCQVAHYNTVSCIPFVRLENISDYEVH